MDSSSAKSPAQVIVDSTVPDQTDNERAASLFRPSRTYHFTGTGEYIFKERQTQSDELREQTRLKTLNECYEFFLDPKSGYISTFTKSTIKADLDMGVTGEKLVFVWLTENKYHHGSGLAVLQAYLAAVTDCFVRHEKKDDNWGPCVLMKPIYKKGEAQAAGYYITPAEVSREPEKWSTAGFRNPDARAPPLYPLPTDEYIAPFIDLKGKFAVPKSFGERNQLSYYWCKLAELRFPDEKPAPLAVPIQPFSFGDVSGRININIGGSATQDVSDFVPPTMDLPLTTDQLKYVARGGRDYFGDHPVAEPDNKLAAAIGTAVAAAITVGVAAALS